MRVRPLPFALPAASVLPVLSLALISVLPGCPSKKSSAPSSSPATATAEEAPSAHHDKMPPLDDPRLEDDLPPDIAPPEPAPQAKIVLVTSGAEPKKKLVYAFSSKTRTVDGTVRRALREGKEPAELVTFHYVFTATPQRAEAGGGATLALKVQKLDIGLPPDAPADAVQAARSLAAGFQSTLAEVDVSPAGQIADPRYAVDSESEAIDMMSRVLERLVVPLPEEPVGIGAKWQEVLGRRDEQGLDVSGDVTMVLVARDAETATIEAEATNAGKVAVPGAPKGTELQRSVKSKSKIVVRLDGVAAKAEATTQIAVTQKVPGEADEEGSIDVTVTATSK